VKEKLEDLILWKKLLTGESDALKQIYDRHSASLYQYGMRMLHDEESVKDCLQDVFIKIWMNHSTLSPTNNIRFYLIAALRNSIINFQLLETRYKKVDIQEHEVFDLNFTVEAAFIKSEEMHEKAQELSLAMNQLSTRQKEIVYLRYFEEMDYDQIAHIMDFSKNSAYKLSARALESLRVIMGLEKSVLIGILLASKHYF